MQAAPFTRPLPNISTLWLFFAAILILAGGFPLLWGLYFEQTAQTGAGRIESVLDQHRQGGKFSSGSDVYDLKIKYQPPPLDRVVSTPAEDKTLWSADETVTFLCNPRHPDEIKLPGFFKRYVKNWIWLIAGTFIFTGWFRVKTR